MDESAIDWYLVGERVHLARRRRRLTSQQLATKAGTTRVTVSKLENARKPRVTLDVVVRIAKALGVSLDYLVGL